MADPDVLLARFWDAYNSGDHEAARRERVALRQHLARGGKEPDWTERGHHPTRAAGRKEAMTIPLFCEAKAPRPRAPRVPKPRAAGLRPGALVRVDRPVDAREDRLTGREVVLVRKFPCEGGAKDAGACMWAVKDAGEDGRAEPGAREHVVHESALTPLKTTKVRIRVDAPRGTAKTRAVYDDGLTSRVMRMLGKSKGRGR